MAYRVMIYIYTSSIVAFDFEFELRRSHLKRYLFQVVSQSRFFTYPILQSETFLHIHHILILVINILFPIHSL